MTSDQLHHLKEKGVAEAKKFFWIFAYLWTFLGLFAAYKSLVLNGPDLFYHQGFALINAFVLAKVMFIAEALNVADDLKLKPLIYPIVYKSAVFALILISFHALEEILSGLWHSRSIAESIDSSGGLTDLIVFGVIVFIVLMPFFAIVEMARDIGNDKLFEQFFLRRNRYIPAANA